MNTELVKIVFEQYDIKEIKGKIHNPEVLKYYKEIGHKWVDNDELAWCAAFANWCLMKAGLPYQKKLNARSFLNLGEKTETPEFLDIVVLWRKGKNSPFGHVGFFIKQDEKNIHILGGNQNNKVGINRYSKNRLLEYRKIQKHV